MSVEDANVLSAAEHAELMAQAHYAGIVPDYEALLERAYSRLIHPGDTVIDVGAHRGRHARAFSRLVGPSGVVHALEPLPEAQDLFARDGIPHNVVLHRVAVAPMRGTAEFVFAQGSPEESGLRQRDYNRPDLTTPLRIQVRTMPLDDLAPSLSSLRFIKLDIEGGEVDALRSGRALVAAYRPWISVEYGRPSYAAFGLEKRDLFDLAERFGYVLGDLFGGLAETIQQWEDACDRSFWDYMMLPREHVEEWRRLAIPIKSVIGG